MSDLDLIVWGGRSPSIYCENCGGELLSANGTEALQFTLPELATAVTAHTCGTVA